jgi:hypothetical protein
MVVKVTSNTDALLKSLEEAKKTITRKLEGMVAHFSEDMARVASGATPVGDLESMQPVSEGGNRRYRAYYEGRLRNYGIPIEPGFHQGAWEFGTPNFKPVINDVQGMLDDVYSEADSKYRLGDMLVIGAEGPGYAALLPRIESANIGSIIQAYTANFQGYYDRS